jgi:hypothetical protein
MGNPFLFADRFSGAVVHLTTGHLRAQRPLQQKPANSKNKKCPRQFELTQAFPD